MRLEGQSLRHFELVLRVRRREGEPLQHHAQDELSFEHGETTPDAGAHAIPERLPRVLRTLLSFFRSEPLGPKRLNIRAPYSGVPMQHRCPSSEYLRQKA